MIHRFIENISHLTIPTRLNNPFERNSSPLATIAVNELISRIKTYNHWREELSKGKMFGVLVVSDQCGEIGYLAAFSATLDGTNIHPDFVPPIYDMLQEDGYFRTEERAISNINKTIKSLEGSCEYIAAKEQLSKFTAVAESRLKNAKNELKESKIKRDTLRKKQLLTADQQSELIRESQFQKAEIKRLERQLRDEIDGLKTALHPFQSEISSLSDERKKRSSALQKWLFSRYIVINGEGETSDFNAIFESTPQRQPPAGAGECAAPKLLNYALLNGLQPIAIAEFWWGESPRGEVRNHGEFYGACKGKCFPILSYMLRGIEVERDNQTKVFEDVELLFEDQYISIFNKPSGMLSEDGLNGSESLMQYIKRLYEYQPYVVHRLDMDTSGVIVVAKDIDSKRILQSQFASHTIYKEYEAVLEGELNSKSGVVALPLSADYNNRPSQMVDYESGKSAKTNYEVVSIEGGRTRIKFVPTTGRTHQLRLHSAHKDGLAHPIVGDNLYGKKDIRLHLHAKAIRFNHPQSGEMVEIETVTPF